MKYEEALKKLGGASDELQRTLKFLIDSGISKARNQWVKCKTDKTWRQLMDEQMVEAEIEKINTAAKDLMGYVSKLTRIAVDIRDTDGNKDPEKIALLEKTINESFEAARKVDVHTYMAQDLHNAAPAAVHMHRDIRSFWKANIDALIMMLEVDFSTANTGDQKEDPKW